MESPLKSKNPAGAWDAGRGSGFRAYPSEELIRLGQADACRWIDEHPTDLWQLDPLPDWSPAPNGASP
jgi:hypothetical protein